MPAIAWIFIAIAGTLLIWLWATFNGLVRRRTQVDEAWADIDVQLKRRYDLIPNLVETVKAYAKHERELFEKVTQARTAAMGATNPKERGQAENVLTGALKSLFAVAEAYPDLKASSNFAKLQDELADTENKIQAARRFYNGNVRDYNISLQQFPTNLIGKPFGFREKDFFEIEEARAGEREPVKVNF